MAMSSNPLSARILAVHLLLICCLTSINVMSKEGGMPGQKESFKLFIHHGYNGAPDFKQYGFEDSVIIYEHQLYKKGESHKQSISPNKLEEITELIIKSPGQYVMLDIEGWINMRMSRSEKNDAIQRFIETTVDLKKLLPNRKIGYYRIVPGYLHPKYEVNRSYLEAFKNESIHRQSLAKTVDVLYPVLYMYPNNIDKWEIWAENIKAASRSLANGKKVIPFLYPKYHPISKSYKEGKRWLEQEVWRKQLLYTFENFDGLIIWIGARGNQGKWNDNIPWWVETKKFLSENGFLDSADQLSTKSGLNGDTGSFKK